MGTVEHFPAERPHLGRWDHLEPIGGNKGATILVLPVVRIERDDGTVHPHRSRRDRDPPLCCGETFEAMKRSFDELHEALKGPPV